MPQVQSLIEQFITEQQYQVCKADSTIRGYKSTLDLLLQFNSKIALQNFTDITLTQFFKFIKERRGGQSLENTMRTHRSHLNVFISWLISKGHLAKSPLKGIPWPKQRKRRERGYLLREETERLIAALETMNWSSTYALKRNRLIFYLALYAGLRKGEIVNLRVADILHGNGKTNIHVRAETAKNRESRSVEVSNKLLDVYQDYIEERKKGDFKTPYLLTKIEKDEPLTSSAIKKMVERLKQKSGVQSFSMHRLRYSCATTLYEQTKDIKRLQKLLGHKLQSTTLDIYLDDLPSSDGLVNHFDLEKMY